MPSEAREGVGTPGAGVTGRCEPPDQGPLEAQS